MLISNVENNCNFGGFLYVQHQWKIECGEIYLIFVPKCEIMSKYLLPVENLFVWTVWRGEHVMGQLVF
jgi:hypothetical protein